MPASRRRRSGGGSSSTIASRDSCWVSTISDRSWRSSPPSARGNPTRCACRRRRAIEERLVRLVDEVQRRRARRAAASRRARARAPGHRTAVARDGDLPAARAASAASRRRPPRGPAGGGVRRIAGGAGPRSRAAADGALSREHRSAPGRDAPSAPGPCGRSHTALRAFSPVTFIVGQRPWSPESLFGDGVVPKRGARSAGRRARRGASGPRNWPTSRSRRRSAVRSAPPPSWPAGSACRRADSRRRRRGADARALGEAGRRRR